MANRFYFFHFLISVGLVCVDEGVCAKNEDIMILHSQLDPADCDGLAKDDLLAAGVIYILQRPRFILSFILIFRRSVLLMPGDILIAVSLCAEKRLCDVFFKHILLTATLRCIKASCLNAGFLFSKNMWHDI